MPDITEVIPEKQDGEFVRFPDSPFELFQPYPPAGDQPEAINKLVEGLRDGEAFQTLLGVTGSGKTFTMANVIARMGRPAIVFAPNKTLAAQLYSEFREFFPKNAVEYFVSYYDMEFEQRNDVDADEYIEMIRLKTAVLLGCALKTGAIIGGATADDAQQLYDFGINIGLAFQLKDDLLDVYGDEATFGKKIGGDILCNKKTYLLIHALELAKDKNAEELSSWLKKNNPDPQEKISAVTNLYNCLGVKKICEDKMLFFYEKAVANLEKVNVPDNKKQELRKLAQKLMSRND
jgi:hypothetical protein